MNRNYSYDLYSTQRKSYSVQDWVKQGDLRKQGNYLQETLSSLTGLW